MAPGAFDFPPSYAPLGQSVIAGLMGEHEEITRPSDVAEAVWRAVTDNAAPTRIPAGADAVTWFKQALGIDTVMLGFGLPDDKIHAPNEKLDLDCYYGGIKVAAALYDKLGQQLR